MSIIDQDFLSEIQSTLIETVDGGVTWSSGLWTATEVLAYTNQRQNRFLKETLLLGSFEPILVPAATLRPTLPADWIATIHATWRFAPQTGVETRGATYPLVKSDSWEADYGITNWITNTGTPLLFMDAEGPTLTCQIAPASSSDGEIDIIYVGRPAQLTGLGEIFTIPDEFVPYIKWGVLADMLGKAGRGQDVRRANYCESRWDEGILVAKLLLTGWNI